MKRFKSSGKKDANGDFEKKGRHVRHAGKSEEARSGPNKPKRFLNTGLKNKDQIVKERRRKEKVQSFQNKKRKGNQKQGKNSWR